MNIVLIIAWVLALISAIVVPPDSAYLSYIDFHTLGLLFCLMAVMAGANRLGVFRQAADRLLTKVKNSHQLELILVFLCFISSNTRHFTHSQSDVSPLFSSITFRK